jgi:uncharacterized protein YndB with AHSA1/START domain
MSNQYPGYVLVIERTFDAPAEEVFEAWTSEEVLRRWFRGDPKWETPTAEVDLRVAADRARVHREGRSDDLTHDEPRHRDRGARGFAPRGLGCLL